MICPKCSGAGFTANARYYEHGSAVSYERGIKSITPCRKCGGTGFIIGNANDLIDRLNAAIEGNEPLTKRALKEIRDLTIKGHIKSKK